MLAELILQSADIKWCSAIVLAPKNYRLLPFCVKYRKLNVVTVRDSNCILEMDEFIGSLSNAIDILNTLRE